eukprot:4114177-Pleurochrysis_carterae.AAC.1
MEADRLTADGGSGLRGTMNVRARHCTWSLARTDAERARGRQHGRWISRTHSAKELRTGGWGVAPGCPVLREPAPCRI